MLWNVVVNLDNPATHELSGRFLCVSMNRTGRSVIAHARDGMQYQGLSEAVTTHEHELAFLHLPLP